MSLASILLPAAWAVLGAALVRTMGPARRIPLDGAPLPHPRGPLARLGALARSARASCARRVGRAGPGAGPVDREAGAADVGAVDVGALDARPVDGRAADAGPVDGGAVDAEVDRLVGGALVLAAVLLVTAPVLAVLPVAGAVAAPGLVRRRHERRRREQWAETLPDAVDLLALGLGSGVAVGPALALVAPHTPSPVGPVLARADERVRHGAALAEALEPLATASADGRSLAALLVAAHDDGAPVVDALARLAGDLRADRRRAVEARARQVPVRMLFPLVACTLPAFVLLTIVPPVVAALSDLQR